MLPTTSPKPIFFHFQVCQLTNLLDSLLLKDLKDSEILEAIFLQALYWSLGGSLQEESRIKFDHFVKYLFDVSRTDNEKGGLGKGKVE